MLFKSRVGSGKGVVCALGNGFCLDHAEDQVEFFKEYVSDADLLVLNYRGVGKSTGASSPLGLALDVYSACEYLHQVHQVDPSEEIVYGHSLGGYAAVKGGALFQAAHPQTEVSIISDRSFSSLSEAAHMIAGAFFSFLAFLLRWELDARDDWDVFRGKKIVIKIRKMPSFHLTSRSIVLSRTRKIRLSLKWNRMKKKGWNLTCAPSLLQRLERSPTLLTNAKFFADLIQLLPLCHPFSPYIARKGDLPLFKVFFEGIRAHRTVLL